MCIRDREEGVPDAEGRQRIWSRMREAYSERVTQVTRVMEAVARSPHPVVLCGDFNDVPVSWALEAARGQLRDTHDLRGLRMDGTWLGAVPGVRIDHILVDPVWPVQDYGEWGRWPERPPLCHGCGAGADPVTRPRRRAISS